MKKSALVLLAIFALQLVAIAAPKDVSFPGKTQSPVTFSHAKHLAVAKMTCKTCHPAIIAKMKSGANKIKMADISKGKFCGICHKEKGKAFAVAANCAKCHVKAES
ncbi:cytochrome C [Candidatus Saganbacteria bacterium]|nr:cytochrome C [Candidatus Saganbacteria bacterium]